MDLQDLNVAVAEIRGNVDRNTGRIKDLEKKTDAVAEAVTARMGYDDIEEIMRIEGLLVEAAQLKN